MQFSKELTALAAQAEAALAGRFAKIDEVAFANTGRVMDAFRANRVSDAMFQSSSGYGYNDKGRETLDCIFAGLMGTEAAFVRHTIASGTHALTIGLFGLLRPGDILYSVAGKPYDTLEEVIGISGGSGNGSLADFGISYRMTELTADGDFRTAEILETLKAEPKIKVVFIQRSKGYLNRKTLSVETIGKLIAAVRTVRNDVFVVVDNCYGEFVETREPGHVGADLITLCSMLRIPVCMHNVPEDQIFRPSTWRAFGMDPEGADYRACAAYGPLFKK